ncbi:MAG: hypothetical protein AMXMBFR64_11530 [Myxococcales bacterium]
MAPPCGSGADCYHTEARRRKEERHATPTLPWMSGLTPATWKPQNTASESRFTINARLPASR